jgi:putative PIN family toxin of toxin-antitoxin system
VTGILRVVLDTNVLLSGLAYPGSVPGKILAAWRHGSVEVMLSDWILNELRRVLPRLVNRHGLSEAEMDDLVDILSIQAELLDPVIVEKPLLRDVKDAAVLGTLVAATKNGSNPYLITGDKDLLVLAERYPIIAPAAFWTLHGQG